MLTPAKIRAADEWIRILYPGATDAEKEKLRKEYFRMTKHIGVRDKKYAKKKKIVVRYKYKIYPNSFLMLVKGERFHIFKRLREMGVRLSYVQLRFLILINYEQLYGWPLEKSLKRVGAKRLKTLTLQKQGCLDIEDKLTEKGMMVYNECIDVLVKRSGFELREVSMQRWVF